MSDLNYTERAKEDIADAWTEYLNRPDLSKRSILEAYLNEQDDELIIYTSGMLLYRFLYGKLKEKYNLDDDSIEKNIDILSERLPFDDDMEFKDLKINIEGCLNASEAWKLWLTKGFTSKQRLFVFKIAICGKMEKEDFDKLLISVDGEGVNKKDPQDIIYNYAYERGYSLLRADSLNEKYVRMLKNPEAYNELDNSICSDDDSAFIKRHINGFDSYSPSTFLVYRLLFNTFKDKYDLTGRSYNECVERIKEIVTTDQNTDFHMISTDSNDWQMWMTVGFKPVQRHIAIKIAICGHMEEEDLLAMLDSIKKGSRKDEEDPYYYAFEKGYSISEADYFFNKKHNLMIDIPNDTYEQDYKQFIEDDQKGWDWRNKEVVQQSNTSKEYLYRYFKNLYANVLPQNLAYDDEVERIAKMIMNDYPEVNCGIKTIKNWLNNGISKSNKKIACEFGLAITDMSYDDYIGLLYSIDSKKYYFPKEDKDYYCIYDYSKFKGYGYKKAESLAKQWHREKNDIGLTEYFQSYIDSQENEDKNDNDFIRDLYTQRGMMNNASVSNIARFARLAQYVACKYDGYNETKIKMKYNEVLPNGADLFLAIYGDGSERQTTYGKGNGIFWDNIGEYFMNFGERFNNKYSILMGDPKKDIRFANVRRGEVLTLAFPLLLNTESIINENKLKRFKCTDEVTTTEWEETINNIWDDFDDAIESVMEIIKKEINPAKAYIKGIKKSAPEYLDKLADLYKSYEKAFDLILDKFDFRGLYPPYIGDRFFIMNLLADDPLSGLSESTFEYSDHQLSYKLEDF